MGEHRVVGDQRRDLAQMGPIRVNGLLHAAAALEGPRATLDAGVRDRHVLVVGAGVIGLLSALLAVRHGAASVSVAEPSAQRRAVAGPSASTPWTMLTAAPG
ncbi:hypothetical protein [Geodermatophilus amargosae]|nr:hypothetical protein [Geodermatophilus amargosae]